MSLGAELGCMLTFTNGGYHAPSARVEEPAPAPAPAPVRVAPAPMRRPRRERSRLPTPQLRQLIIEIVRSVGAPVEVKEIRTRLARAGFERTYDHVASSVRALTAAEKLVSARAPSNYDYGGRRSHRTDYGHAYVYVVADGV